MRFRIAALALALSSGALGQAFRVDSSVMTVNGSCQPGQMCPALLVPGSTVSVSVTTYTDATGVSQCPSTAPITLPGSALCQTTTGPQGQFGFWAPAGSFTYRVTLPSGKSYGPYSVTVGGASAASAVSFTQAGSATLLSVQAKLQQTINVRDFGAMCDGSTDDSQAINSAASYLGGLGGGALQFPVGGVTCKMSSAAFIITHDNVLIAGQGATLNSTVASAGLTVQNAQNVQVQNLMIASVQDGVMIQTTNGSHPTEYPLLQNVTISAVGAGYARVHVNSAACCVYFPTFINVNASGGTPGTTSGFLFDGTPGYNIRPLIVGGRIADAKYGLNVVSADHLTVIGGTEFDDILASGSGIGIWLKTGVSNTFIEQPRLEGDGSGADIDKDIQIDSGAYATRIDLDNGYSGATSQVTDAGNTTCITGGNASGGFTPSCLLPQILGITQFSGNVTINSGTVLSMPGTTASQFTVNGGLTSDQLGGVACLMCVKGPNSNFGYPLALMMDSSGRGIDLVTQNYSSSGSTGTSMLIGSGGIIYTVSGTGAVLPFNFGIQVSAAGGNFIAALGTPGNGTMIYCKDCKNVVDDGATAGATCVGSGSGAIARRENGSWRCN